MQANRPAKETTAGASEAWEHELRGQAELEVPAEFACESGVHLPLFQVEVYRFGEGFRVTEEHFDVKDRVGHSRVQIR